ncbi:Rcs stress response system protein RcsF [Ferrimonas senticii]|uniref:Rcs stress response system protein RcsF n=1 Tax=Ferrimonas senticii TaxID=394566 RepID=UPI000421064A|nr:Rcs stress response system protein RcsF [Ferrimonas senticii]
MRVRLFSASMLLTALLGCSNNYSFNSNLDGQRIDQYFAVGQVQVTDAAPAHAQSLGFVDGLSCQSGNQQPVANEADARTALRKAAATLGANTVVIRQCVALAELPGCLSAIQCSAEAFGISQP